MCSRTARLGGVIGSTGFLSANVQCQGILSPDIDLIVKGGVAPRHQFTQADPSLRVTRAPIDLQQLSSGSVLGLITGYLAAKIGRIFFFGFGGIFLLAAVIQ